MSWPRTRSGAPLLPLLLVPPPLVVPPPLLLLLLLLCVVLHEVCTAVLRSGPTRQKPALRVQRRIHPWPPA